MANGIVYVGSDDGKLYAFDAASGTPKWTAPTGGALSAAPAVAHGIVYIGSGEGKLYAFDAATGTRRWATSARGALTSPAVANGVVYVSSDDGHLYPFDAAGNTGCSGSPKVCGPLLAASGVSTAISPSSPVLVNGLIYVTGADGAVHVFGLP